MGRQLMGLREYARYRESKSFPGGTLRAVQKAIETGRITTIADEKGRVKIDPEVADIQWGRNTDPEQSARANVGREPTSPGIGADLVTTAAGAGQGQNSLYWDARTRREQAEAEKAEIQLKEMSGELVDREAVRRAAYEAGRLLRDMLLALPGTLAQDLAAIAGPQEIEIRLRDELRKVLDQVARVTETSLDTRIG